MSDQIHDTYSVNKIEEGPDKLWVLEIFGAYAGANFSQKKIRTSAHCGKDQWI